MDPAPILQYVANQLFAGNSKETIVLRELISKMTNIRPIENLSDDQVICMGGGPLLRIQAIASDTRGAYSSRLQSGNANATKRIVSALRKTNLTLPLLILLAQTRQFCIHHLENAETHLKYASNLVDEVSAINRVIFFRSLTYSNCAVSSRSFPIYRVPHQRIIT
jgi:THO complex subunit 2